MKFKMKFDRKLDSVVVSVRGGKEFKSDMRLLVKNLNILIPKLPELIENALEAVRKKDD